MVVTGAARGIGAAIARAFAHEGGRVLILDKLAEQAEGVAAEIQSQGGMAEALTVQARTRRKTR
jgi:NAD(P)-dependent dehydrogenase (short-subunit alcohol dehydrogenase family)